jgi:hypothetical protein
MQAENILFNTIRSKVLQLKINLWWRLEYFMVMLRKKNEELIHRI